MDLHAPHTRLDELKRLCEHHHDLKTNHGWDYATTTGPTLLVPLTDPRHPNYRGPPQ